MATIMVVDDYPTIRQTLVTLLDSEGHRVLEACDGGEALELVRAERPDLVITDLLMPTMDGYEFVRQLRADPPIAQTPVIFHTGVYLEPEARTLARACGVVHIIIKPLTPEEILSTVDAALSLPRHPPAVHLPPASEEFSREHLHLLTYKLSQKVKELEQEVLTRKELEAEIERRRREAEVMADLASTIGASLDLTTVLQRVTKGARRLCGSDNAAIALREVGAQAMVIRYETGVCYQGFQTVHIQPGKGLGGLVLATGRPQRTDHYAEDPRISKDYLEVIRGDKVVSLMGVPIWTENRVEGVIYVANRALRPFSDQDEQTLLRLADHAAIAIQNARLFEEVRQGREQLLILSRHLLAAQEMERQRLSRELHDEAGQLLTALKLSLTLLQTDLPLQCESFRGRFTEAVALTDTTLERIRVLAHDLRPSALDTVGLSPALEGLCHDFAGRTHLAIAYESPALPALPEAIMICLFRCVQEALTNVAKHASATRVSVALCHDGATLSLSVADDGQGFDMQDRLADGSRPPGIGLLGIRERLELLGGWLQLESRPGCGTRLIAHIPWREGP